MISRVAEHDTTAIHVCLDATEAAEGEDRAWLTGPPPTDTVVIRADDLGEAQAMRTRIRREHGTEGDGATSVAVVLELEVHIADDARTARMELASSSHGEPKTVRYVGTSNGLAGLISDIKSASVADGVLIVPVVAPHRVAVVNRVAVEVIPLLERPAV